MNCSEFNATILTPALTFIRANLKTIPPSVEEHTMLLAIAGQESNWSARRQANNGPAVSYWQFERGGGIVGLMRDDETSRSVASLCGMAGVPFQSTAIWRFMATPEGDNFSAAMARLLLWTDPMPLPKMEDDGWRYYLRLWRPGKPDQSRFRGAYQQAAAEVGKKGAGA